jgi:SAM-dependent methyltransferase
MKIRESGMPEEERWNSFFDASAALELLGCDSSCADVAEFGCGYGLFSLAAGRVVTGTVHAFDIDPEMVARTNAHALSTGLANVVAEERDFVAAGSGLADGCCDYVMLFNILHLEEPVPLLREGWRVLAKGGRAGVMHWVQDPSTPRGPSMGIRPSPDQCAEWAVAAGFRVAETVELMGCPYHFGLVLIRD